MLRKLLFFSKYDGDKISEKLDEVLENQKNIQEEIKKINLELSKNKENQEKVLQECSFLLEKQEKDNENIYGIVNQLLLKDLLKVHKNVINEILSENKEEKKEIKLSSSNSSKNIPLSQIRKMFGISDNYD